MVFLQCCIYSVSCPMRGCFLEAVLQRTERKLAGPGRPGTVDGLVAEVERREALRPTLLGARGSLAARGGYVNPASKGARWCPGVSRRSTPSLGLARDWQTSDAVRRENADAWLFEICGSEIYDASTQSQRGPAQAEGQVHICFAGEKTNTAVILRCSPFFTASLEGWAASARGDPSRRRASARLLRTCECLAFATGESV